MNGLRSENRFKGSFIYLPQPDRFFSVKDDHTKTDEKEKVITSGIQY